MHTILLRIVQADPALLLCFVCSVGAISTQVSQSRPLDTVNEKGFHGHQTCESPILVNPKVRRQTGQRYGPFLLCVPYKNGWNWWTTTTCDAEHHGHVCHEDYYNKTQAIDFLWWKHSETEIMATYTDHTLPKIKLIRNPLTRVLSAWLTWVTKLQPGDYNYVDDSFNMFVKYSMTARTNCHWSRQTRYCSEDEGVEYELLKVEDRHLWSSRILERFGLTEAARVNGGLRNEVRSRCPGHECSALPLMAKYYTPELVALVKAHYAEELALYNYTESFREWEDTIAWAFEDGSQVVRNQGIPTLQAKLDLDMLESATGGFAASKQVLLGASQ